MIIRYYRRHPGLGSAKRVAQTFANQRVWGLSARTTAEFESTNSARPALIEAKANRK